MNNLCECGCGKETTINRDTKKSNRFLPYHYPKTKEFKELITGVTRPEEVRKKISSTLMGHYGYMTGHHHTEEMKRKIGTDHRGKIVSIKTREKLSMSHKGHIMSEKTRLKLSISTKNHMKKLLFCGGKISPRIGVNETLCLNNLESIFDFKIERQYIVDKKYFLDGYISKLNIAIEFDEQHHFIENGTYHEVDIQRELEISSFLGCIIFRIKQKEWEQNKDNIIERFQMLLDLCV